MSSFSKRRRRRRRVRTTTSTGSCSDRGFHSTIPRTPRAAGSSTTAACTCRTSRRAWSSHSMTSPCSRRRPPAAPAWTLVLCNSPRSAACRQARLAAMPSATRGGAARTARGVPETTNAGGAAQPWRQRSRCRLADPSLLAGTFLEDELETSSRFFACCWRHSSAVTPSVPATGMGDIPRRLPASSRSASQVRRRSLPSPPPRLVSATPHRFAPERLSSPPIPGLHRRCCLHSRTTMNSVTTYYHVTETCCSTAMGFSSLTGTPRGPVITRPDHMLHLLTRRRHDARLIERAGRAFGHGRGRGAQAPRRAVRHGHTALDDAALLPDRRCIAGDAATAQLPQTSTCRSPGCTSAAMRDSSSIHGAIGLRTPRRRSRTRGPARVNILATAGASAPTIGACPMPAPLCSMHCGCLPPTVPASVSSARRQAMATAT